MAVLTPIPKFVVLDDNGDPAALGKVYTYLAQSTTPADTYQNAGGTLNNNPVILDSAGRADIWLDPEKSYKFIVKTAQDVTLYTVDNISSSSANISFTQSAVGATTTTVQAELRRFTTIGPNLASASTLNFDADETGDTLTVTGTTTVTAITLREGNSRRVRFSGALLLTNGASLVLPGGNDIKTAAGDYATFVGYSGGVVRCTQYQRASGAPLMNNVSQGRHVVTYKDADEVYIRGNGVAMLGFRHMGVWSKTGGVPYFPFPAQTNAVSCTTDLGCESSVAVENWYAVFAVANAGDASCSFKLMPFIRAKSVASSTVSCNKAGEGIHTAQNKSYSWTTDNLAGTECLVITETVDARANAFSGRVTTITANATGTPSTLTLSSIGAVGALDFLLPAPPGYDYFCYLGSFYFDTAEVRNIADSGHIVKAKMSTISTVPATNEQATPVDIECGGYICPLATGIVIDDTVSFSTSSTGSYADYFASDTSLHTIETVLGYKEAAATITMTFSNVTLPFSFWQKYAWSTSGDIDTLASGRIHDVTGWIEL